MDMLFSMCSFSHFRSTFALLLVLAVLPFHILANDRFVVEDLRIDGLKRVSAGTVFSDFPISVGDAVDQRKIVAATKRLFKTGLFTDLEIKREGDDLVVLVEERPAIAKIDIQGNKNISEDDLREGLRGAGMAEGKVFKRVTLDRLELEILRSYVAQGRYNASIKAEVVELPRNRVEIVLNIDEGKVASILHVNIVGNDAFEDEVLTDLMELKVGSFWSVFSSDDKYSKEKLSGDLERIRSHYLNNGYLKFAIESTQVSISPYKEHVYVTINVSEGPQFTVREFALKGELILEEQTLRDLVNIEQGDVFSRQKITTASDIISRVLGSEGYTYANVNPIPEPNDDNTTSITFYVDPGKRNYVRRINFRGNTSTSDDVLRQEMIQMEGASASTDLIEASKTRLERLGFFSTVDVDTVVVPGLNDQIDVNYTVEEQSSGNLSASLGFSQGSGLTLGLSVSESNFFGTGKRVSFGLNKSSTVKSANFSYLNPYYTVDGVSRGFSLFARKTDFEEDDNRSDYVLDSTGGSVTFGYPIDNVSRLSFGLGYTHTDISSGAFLPLQIERFLAENGERYDFFELSAGWSRSTLNRGMFPTKGWRQNLNLDVFLPISDLSFYKAAYRSDFYQPVDKAHKFVLRARHELAWAGTYGSTKQVPFFEHYFSGGISSVRGYESNSLGLRTTPNPSALGGDDPFGGNLLVENAYELIFPIPFLKEQRSMRLSYFVDGGNVFDTERNYDFDFRELRWSTGLSLRWNTFIGPLGFSFGKAINATASDEKQFFQFSLGQTF